MTVIYTIVLAIISSFSYIVAVALFVGIVFLVIRNDLVSAAIARELHRQKPTVVTVVDDDEENYYWTNAARRLSFEAVPPAVRIQMLVNLLQKFKANRLNPTDKRLKTVTTRLTAMMATYRRARMAYDFETSEMYELSASNNRLTMSIGTNTEYSENSTISKPRIVKKRLESLNKKVSTVEPSVESVSKKPLPSDVKFQSKSIHSVEQTQSGLIAKLPSTSAVQPTQPESLTEMLKKLAASLISVILWFKNALTSKVYRRKAVAVYKAINSILNSQYLKIFFKFVFDSFDNIVKLYTHIDMNDSDITSVMIRIPATENDEE